MAGTANGAELGVTLRLTVLVVAAADFLGVGRFAVRVVFVTVVAVDVVSLEGLVSGALVVTSGAGAGSVVAVLAGGPAGTG